MSWTVYTNYKDQRARPGPSAGARWEDPTGPGPVGDVPSTEATRLGNDGYSSIVRGYLPTYLLQNPAQGLKVLAPKGSASAISYGFRSGPTGTTEQNNLKTGMYQSAASNVDFSIAGTNEINFSATGILVAHDIAFKSATSFKGTFEHNNSADRTYTMQNSSGTVAFLADIPASPVPIDNTELEDMAAWTTKIRNAGTTGDPSDAAAGDLTTEASPASGDFLWIWTDEGGGTFQIKKVNWSSLPGGGGTNALLDGSVHSDTVAQTPSKGSLIAGKTSPSALWDELVVGTDTHVLTADSTQTLGVKWAAPATQTSVLLDGSVHTDTVAQTVSRGSIIYGNSTPKWDELVVGSATKPYGVLSNDGTDVAWRQNQGAAVYVPTTADDAINSVTDITIETRDVTNVSAGDQVVMEGSFTIVNDSGATRVYAITLDFDGTFDCEISTGALATSATLRHQFQFKAYCDIRATNLAYCTIFIGGGLAAGVASGADITMAATDLTGSSWGTTTNDLTGTLTCALKIRSANATATQTCRLHNFVIRKFTPFSI